MTIVSKMIRPAEAIDHFTHTLSQVEVAGADVICLLLGGLVCTLVPSGTPYRRIIQLHGASRPAFLEQHWREIGRHYYRPLCNRSSQVR